MIDEHGSALVSDFRSYHGVWLWELVDQVPPRIVLALVEELPDYEAFAASVQGGRDFRGWGVDLHVQANLWDLLAKVNTDPKKKAPTHPRPVKMQKNSGGLFGLMSAIPKGGTK